MTIRLASLRERVLPRVLHPRHPRTRSEHNYVSERTSCSYTRASDNCDVTASLPCLLAVLKCSVTLPSCRLYCLPSVTSLGVCLCVFMCARGTCELRLPCASPPPAGVGLPRVTLGGERASLLTSRDSQRHHCALKFGSLKECRFYDQTFELEQYGH